MHTNVGKEIVIEMIRIPGRVTYKEGIRLQQERRAGVEDGRLSSAVFLLEHAPVITLGRSAHAENVLRTPEELAAMGIDLCEADRGGDVTYHGPGQLVDDGRRSLAIVIPVHDVQVYGQP